MRVNGFAIFMAKGTKVNPYIRGKNLVIIYGFPEGSFVITNKVVYMDDETLGNVVKVVAPGIRKIKVSNVAYVLPILFSIYLTIHICP